MNHPHRLHAILIAGVVGAAPLMAQAPAPGQAPATATTRTLTLAVPPTHLVVAREPGRYGGWPANHGMWAWGNEILVGFSWGHMSGGTAAGGPSDRSAAA